MKQVVTLDELGEDRFLFELKRLKYLNRKEDKRNRGWFDQIPKTYKDEKYLNWFFLLDNKDEIWSFSTIQRYYEGCYRLLTRTYVFPEYRRYILTNEYDKRRSQYLLEYQLDYIGNYETIFISMQGLKFRKVLNKFKDKDMVGIDWKLHENMVQTCDDIKSKDCWQNVIYDGEKPKLNSITLNHWKKLD